MKNVIRNKSFENENHQFYFDVYICIYICSVWNNMHAPIELKNKKMALLINDVQIKVCVRRSNVTEIH